MAAFFRWGRICSTWRWGAFLPDTCLTDCGVTARVRLRSSAGVLSFLVSACLALSQLLLSGVRIPPRMLWVSLGFFFVSALLGGAIPPAAVRAIERLRPLPAV